MTSTPKTPALGWIASLLSSYLSHPSTPLKSEAENNHLDPMQSSTKLSKSKYGDHDLPFRNPPPSAKHTKLRSSSIPRREQMTNRLQQKIESTPPIPPQYPHPTSIDPSRRERAMSLAPPILPASDQNRPSSSPATSRPTSHQYHSETAKRDPKRKSGWLGLTSHSRKTSKDINHTSITQTWVVKDGIVLDYDVSSLIGGQKVPELWSGPPADTFVHLFPRETGGQAQFNIHSPVIASSLLLHELSIDGTLAKVDAQRERSLEGRPSLAIDNSVRNFSLNSNYNTHPGVLQPRSFPNDNLSNSDGSCMSMRSLQEGPRDYHLYFPTKLIPTGSDLTTRNLHRLIDVRNLFAFLEGQVLVMSRDNPGLFHVLITVAELLQEFGFTNFDGSTFGESASYAFNCISSLDELGNVSQSREKTIEGLILGERMRSVELYNECFAHAVGKYKSVKEYNPFLYNLVSANTRQRLDRAHLDLTNRRRAAELRLTEFEFPSLFAGIANSTSSNESKFVHFKAWKSHFLNLRKTVLSYYRDVYGQWPPKASSKKKNFTERGLNRVVLKSLYNDLCGLYEYLADREAITTRGMDASEDKDPIDVDPTIAVLRRLLAEFDRSSPPVPPPIPFDVPLIPSLATIFPEYHSMSPKEQNKLLNKKLKDHENLLILAKSHQTIDRENDQDQRHIFLEMFRAFEVKESRGKTCSQLADMRYGHWIFLYATLQSLPMLVVDAPGLTPRYSEGVEYFLCEPSIGNPPWMEDAGVKREWYGVAGSGHTNYLPSDLITHGVEGVYRRSFCWTKAAQWINDSTAGSIHEDFAEMDGTPTLSPLHMPPAFIGEFYPPPIPRSSGDGSSVSSEGLLRPVSRGRTREFQRKSIALGLERLPIPNATGSPMLSATSSRGTSPASLTPHDYGSRRVSSSGPIGRILPSEEHKGTTFDDILGNIAPEKTDKEQKVKNRKSRFGI